MKTANEYIASLRDRQLRLFLRGEQVDHPLIAPSIRTVAETYRLAEDPKTRDLAVAWSRFIDGPVNRFTHIFESEEDLHAKQRMQRLLGQITGTCFQRCVGMDALNAGRRDPRHEWEFEYGHRSQPDAIGRGDVA